MVQEESNAINFVYQKLYAFKVAFDCYVKGDFFLEVTI